eukprot:1726840-Rhodomonas_salina.2
MSKASRRMQIQSSEYFVTAAEQKIVSGLVSLTAPLSLLAGRLRPLRCPPPGPDIICPGLRRGLCAHRQPSLQHIRMGRTRVERGRIRDSETAETDGHVLRAELLGLICRPIGDAI